MTNVSLCYRQVGQVPSPPSTRDDEEAAPSLKLDPDARVFVLPQTPYALSGPGSLRELLLYGLSSDENADRVGACLADVVDALDLHRLVARHGYDASRDWKSILSPGERQRVAAARLLLRLRLDDAEGAGTLVLIDEGTSHLDERTEELVYQALIETDATLVSFGHRVHSLRPFHSRVVDLGKFVVT